MGLIYALSLIYNLGLAYLNAVVHVRPGAKSLKPSEPSHLNLLVQGNQVCSGIHGGFFIFRSPVSTPESNATDPIVCTEAAHMRQDTGQLSAQSKRTLRRELRLHGLVNEHGWFTFVGEEPLTQFEED